MSCNSMGARSCEAARWHVAAWPSEAAGAEPESLAEEWWWSWRELNPRPQAFNEQFYMFSDLFWFSPDGSRSRTLSVQPAPYFLALPQGTRSGASQCR